jgi:mRNA-degrading endonuclease RelE of RelBE toxin-antitoxin system
MFRITFGPRAVQSWPDLPRQAQLRFNRCFDLLQTNPRERRPGLDLHQLHGYQNVWTLVLAPYRGIYAIDGNEVIVIIFGDRDDIYPKLHALLPPEKGYLASELILRRR